MDEVFQEARERGRRLAVAEIREGCEESRDPLSGEWAGESVTELIGDLVARVVGSYDDEGDAWADVADEYEAGYFTTWTEVARENGNLEAWEAGR
jgi:hypothetical protein